MTDLDDVIAFVLVADRVVNDDGRMHVSTAGVRVLPLGDNGVTAGTAVLAMADLPVAYLGRTVEVGVSLRDTRTDEVVQFATDTGEPFTVRLGQQILVEPAAVPGADIPAEFGARIQFVVEMSEGLPLEADVTYAWDFEVDGRHEPGWTARFHVARFAVDAAPAGATPVFEKPRLLTEVDGRSLIEYVVPPRTD